MNKGRNVGMVLGMAILVVASVASAGTPGGLFGHQKAGRGGQVATKIARTVQEPRGFQQPRGFQEPRGFQGDVELEADIASQALEIEADVELEGEGEVELELDLDIQE
ncbi:hypothetical protein [Polyangium jinanense]|uniref:Secreted protein n=1 Tax=Polyangium jinanense TaxID=2829994 RepID=A0A9X3X8V3_9BACT|nr:hypothetical protein [Polyangium jinanense]MDC3959871.1 hypothetical protein [Polyangium jinanense]MDC3986322.1 hypothetical protein [Polyangium jinanense]